MNTRAVPQPLQALIISTIVVATLLGAFILAANDQTLHNPIGLPNPIETLVAVVSRTPIGTQVPPPGSLTPGAVTADSTATITPTPTPTLTPTPVCPVPPVGWVPIVYSQSDMTLPMLALRYNTTVDLLRQINCLDRVPLQAIQTLYVPAAAPTLSPTLFSVSCFPPPGWPTYIVQWGDTLSRLAVRYGLSIEQLMRYNCLTSWVIYQGQRLYVPYVIAVPTWTPWPTFTWTPTPIVVTPSDTPTPTGTTPPVPTDTPEPPATPTFEVPTETPVIPSITPSFTPSPTLPPPTETPAPPTETAVPPTLPVSPLGTPIL